MPTHLLQLIPDLLEGTAKLFIVSQAHLLHVAAQSTPVTQAVLIEELRQRVQCVQCTRVVLKFGVQYLGELLRKRTGLRLRLRRKAAATSHC